MHPSRDEMRVDCGTTTRRARSARSRRVIWTFTRKRRRRRNIVYAACCLAARPTFDNMRRVALRQPTTTFYADNEYSKFFIVRSSGIETAHRTAGAPRRYRDHLDHVRTDSLWCHHQIFLEFESIDVGRRCIRQLDSREGNRHRR